MSVLDLSVLRVLHARAVLSCVSILYRLVECLALVCLICLHGHSGVCWFYWPHVCFVPVSPAQLVWPRAPQLNHVHLWLAQLVWPRAPQLKAAADTAIARLRAENATTSAALTASLWVVFALLAVIVALLLARL